MNAARDLPAMPTQAPYVHPILSGAVWKMAQRGPWPSPNAIRVTILGTSSGWVRFRVNEYAPDERLTDEDFRRSYEHADENDAAEDLRERFETWARNHNWKVELHDANGPYAGQYKCDRTQHGWCAFVAGARGYCS